MNELVSSSKSNNSSRAIPLPPIVTSMPGVGPRTAIALLLAVRDGTRFRQQATSPPTQAGAGNPAVRSLDPRGAPAKAREPAAPLAAVLVVFRQSQEPDQPQTTTTANAPRDAVTAPPCSAWHVDAPTSSTR